MAERDKHKKPKPRTKPARKPPADASDRSVKLRSVSELHKTLRWLIVTAGVVLALFSSSYYGFRAVEAAAGKETNFNAMLQAFANLRLSEYAAWTLVLLLGGSNVYNYKGRRKAEAAASRAADLERTIDPARTGSGLLQDGGNPAGDPE